MSRASKKIRTRYAPSPTGFLHLGGLRTTLYNWLFARANGGEFLLRVEDTDQARHVDASVDQILESIKMVGMDWDGEVFFQSKRSDIYQEYFQKLIDADLIYPAFETMEELEEMRQLAMKEKRPAVYNRAARDMPREERDARIKEGEPHIWRFKTPLDGDTNVSDLLMGGDECCFANAQIGDFAITRPGTADQPPQVLYNLAATVDDALMGITHVIRGVEHLGNAAKQVLLYKAWGFDIPKFVHLPLILKGGKKMSKRDTDADPAHPVSVTARRDIGYLPEAIINYIALLGWSPEDENELFTLDDLIKNFSLERLSKSNANFDEDKFLHVNAWHIRHLDLVELKKRIRPFLENGGYDPDIDWLERALPAARERCSLLSDFPVVMSYLYDAPQAYDDKAANKFFTSEHAVSVLEKMYEKLEQQKDFSAEALEDLLQNTVNEMGLKFGQFGPVLRLALTGTMQSLGLSDVMSIIGKSEAADRLKTAREYIISNNLTPR